LVWGRASIVEQARRLDVYRQRVSSVRLTVTALEPLQLAEGGYVYLPEGPGLGTELVDGLERRADTTVRVSRL
jgi:hypothetical protein